MTIKKITLGVLILAALAVPALAKKKRYEVDSISVNARVEADGDLWIEESLDYTFSGRYRFAYRDIPLKDGENVSHITVQEGAQAYVEADSEEPGTFEIRRRDNEIRITWYYSARDEPKSFRVGYRLTGAVHRYPQTAELFYYFVGSGWDTSIGSATAAVHLPAGASSQNVHAWTYGAPDQPPQVSSDGVVRLQVPGIPKRSYWGARILFPAELLPSTPLQSESRPLDRVVRDEGIRIQQELADQRAARVREIWQAEMAGRLLPVSLALMAAAAIIFVLLYLQYGKAHSARPSLGMGVMPESTPALIGYIYNRSVGVSSLVATLLDLTRRGYYRIHEEVQEKKGWLGTGKRNDYYFERTGKSFDRLQPFEKDLAEFIESEVGTSGGFRVSDFKKMARQSGSRSRKWFREWSKKVKDLGKEQEIFEPTAKKGLGINIFSGILILSAGAAISILTNSPAGVPAIGAALLQLAFTPLLLRRTQAGQRKYNEWKAFRRYLKEFSRQPGAVPVGAGILENFLVASVALGMMGELKRLTKNAGEAMVFPWFLGESLSGAFDDNAGIPVMVASLSSSMSSASGLSSGAGASGAGGASGGGGGGAG